VQIPHCGDIAQSARGVLDVRLELIDRAVELRMTLLHQIHQRGNRPAAVVGAEIAGSRPEALEERLIAANRPCIEHGQLKLGVADVEIVEIGKLADLMADDELQIPEWLEHGIDETFLLTSDWFFEQDHQVDVGVEAQRSPPVSPERTDDHRRRGVRSRRLDELPDDTVHVGGIAGLGVTAAAPLFRLEREFAPGARERGGELSPPPFAVGAGAKSCLAGRFLIDCH
jgi:hypothetical protein